MPYSGICGMGEKRFVHYSEQGMRSSSAEKFHLVRLKIQQFARTSFKAQTA
jgi:hypothetical protein